MKPWIRRHLSRFCLGFLVLVSAPGASAAELSQPPEALIAGESWAVAYSGYREGQHPDRGDGAVNPSSEQILEDLKILRAHGFRLLRLYDTGENSREVLELIRRHGLPFKVLLGFWLDAEVSNHEGCPWLTEPIPPATLAANRGRNAAAVQTGIALAKEFPSIVRALNVGNEALVEWNDHMVPVEQVIAYVRIVREAVTQPVTVAENYAWWAAHGRDLAAELDFIGVHTYPQWEGKTVEEALAFTLENLADVRRALPDKPIAILEAGWATTASEFGPRASEPHQLRHYHELKAWAAAHHTTVFFFEAFDEPWKGDPTNALGAEKHWGLFFVDRQPKRAMRAEAPAPPSSR
jgi:exo-beta-1,3-glucanase (GH17 family)